MSAAELYKIYLKHPTICTDTRKITEGCLFFALKGPNFNGNAFAADALKQGAAYAIIDEASYVTGEQTILTNDVLLTLQQLATYHRDQLNIPVIAIVGSNGKTTTKELITAVLSQQYKVHATPGNFNNHIGLPLTLLQLNAAHQIAIIEMGANHIGENAALCEIAKPTLGVITNNGKDHLEGFGSIEGVAQSNSELYYYLLKHNGLAFVNAHDEWLMRMASRLSNKKTYAGNYANRNVHADYTAEANSVNPEISFRIRGEHAQIDSVLSGDYNFDNIMAAVAFGLHLNLSYELIKQGIESYIPSNNRSQIIRKEHNSIFLDAYNANPSSMEVALRNFAQSPVKNKVAILGDMFELGAYEAAEHAQIISLAAALKIDEVILVGKAFEAQNKIDTIKSFETTEEAKVYIQSKNYRGANFFIKGSRGMRLETLLDCIN
jgi:UDP-N-acetylmuramoyl-tripeptide--D-alanyl-D-alanine ligase